jgi:LysW-gamma-L-lysine carboxypeptidase
VDGGVAVRPLYVVKVGSSTLDHETIFAELGELVARGARVLLVAGGAVGIARHYRALGRPSPQLRLAGGDTVRYCPPAEMPHLVAAYEQVTLPAVEAGLARHGQSVFTAVAAHGGLVGARVNPPLRVTSEHGRTAVIRDHRVGVPAEVDTARLTALLDAYDVVCLSPPVRDLDGGTPLNVDADVLAAACSNALGADHLRLVTGTAGLLTDPADPGSTLSDAHLGEGAVYAGGRMRQKVRAAEMALAGSADVAITGPHTMSDPSGWTRFWRTRAPAPDLALLGRAVGVPSVSGDERRSRVTSGNSPRTWSTGAGGGGSTPRSTPSGIWWRCGATVHAGCCCSATWTRSPSTGRWPGSPRSCSAGAAWMPRVA